MLPPVCHICDEPLEDNSGGLIYFRKTPKDIEWDSRMDDESMTGHPPYAAWFCGKHYPMAKKYMDLTFVEAMKILNNL